MCVSTATCYGDVAIAWSEGLKAKRLQYVDRLVLGLSAAAVSALRHLHAHLGVVYVYLNAVRGYKLA